MSFDKEKLEHVDMNFARYEKQRFFYEGVYESYRVYGEFEPGESFRGSLMATEIFGEIGWERVKVTDLSSGDVHLDETY